MTPQTTLASSDACLTFGGRLSKSDLKDLTAAIFKDCHGHEPIPAFEHATHVKHVLIAQHHAGQPMKIMAKGISGGVFAETEAYLQAHGMSYFRHDAGCSTYPAMYSYYTPFEDGPLNWFAAMPDIGQGLSIAAIEEALAEGTLTRTLERISQANRFAIPFFIPDLAPGTTAVAATKPDAHHSDAHHSDAKQTGDSAPRRHYLVDLTETVRYSMTVRACDKDRARIAALCIYGEAPDPMHEFAGSSQGAVVTSVVETQEDISNELKLIDDDEPVGMLLPDGSVSLQNWDERLRDNGCLPLYRQDL